MYVVYKHENIMYSYPWIVAKNSSDSVHQCKRLVCDFRDTVARDWKGRTRGYAIYIFFFSKIDVLFISHGKEISLKMGEVSIHYYIKSSICSCPSLVYYSPGFKVVLMQAMNRSIPNLCRYRHWCLRIIFYRVVPQSRSSLIMRWGSSMILISTHLYIIFGPWSLARVY